MARVATISHLLLVTALTLSSHLPTGSTEGTSKLPCLSNRPSIEGDGKDFRYNNIEEYTSDMCAQCYSFILSSGLNLKPKPGTNGIMERPLFYYIIPNTGLLCETSKPKKYCKYVLPDKFNRSNPEVDYFLKTFKTQFHMVSKLGQSLGQFGR